MSINVKTQNFSRSQVIINNMPIDTSFVVDGGPGTGKTLLALNRTAKIIELGPKEYKKEPDVLFIIYNRALMDFIKDQAKQIGLGNQNVKTYHQWLWNIYKNKKSAKYPQFAPYKPIWDEVKSDLVEWCQKGNFGYDHVILDEAQDLPFELIEIFSLISKNVTVFMDPQQKIDSGSSFTVEDVASLLCKDQRKSRFYLNENHRNSQAITDFAFKFDPDGGNFPPKSINVSGRKPEHQCITDANEYSKHIVKYFSDNPDQVIGVILADKLMKDRYYQLISKLTEETEVYISSSDLKGNSLKFDINSPGIKVLNVGVCKGLEFDTVFIPEIDNVYWFKEEDKKINQAMVAITRAKKRLFLQANNSNIDSIKVRSFFQRIVIDNTPELVEHRVLSLTKVENSSTSNSAQIMGGDFDDDIPF